MPVLPTYLLSLLSPLAKFELVQTLGSIDQCIMFVVKVMPYVYVGVESAMILGIGRA